MATDILGASGRDMLAALLGGEQDPAVLAELARGRLRAKLPELRQALAGRVQPQHRALLAQMLAHIDYLEAALADLQVAIEEHLTPFAEAVELLQTIPGVGATAAAAIVAELGVDMGRFPDAKHLASWAGVCPGNKQSGGKRLSGKTTKGNVWLRGMLGEVAWAAARSKGSYPHALFQRVARRRGRPKAILAVAHSLLRSIYFMLRDRQPYRDLGPDHFDRLNTVRLERHHVRRLEQLGYTVTLTPAQVA